MTTLLSEVLRATGTSMAAAVRDEVSAKLP